MRQERVQQCNASIFRRNIKALAVRTQLQQQYNRKVETGKELRMKQSPSRRAYGVRPKCPLCGVHHFEWERCD